MDRKGWLYAVIVILILANAFVFYRLFSQRITTNSSSSLAVAEPSNQRQQTSKDKNRNAVVVPILMYHYIRDYTNPDDQLGIQLSVAPTVFKKQLVQLKAAGYQTISLEDFADGKLKPKSIILTFDDGYADHYTDAFPILQDEKMTATFFIVKNFVGRPDYMTAKEITELADNGMEIGAHSLTHRNLAAQTEEVATKEIRDSLRATAPVFAYPSGKYSALTVAITKALGVKASVTTNLGVATTASDLTLLPRIRIKQQTNILKVIEEQTYILDHPEIKPSDPSLEASQAN